LTQAGIAHTVLPKDVLGVDETPQVNEAPEHYVERLAIEKARAGWQALTPLQLAVDAVLGADTTVSIDHHILEKPRDASDAARMLKLLSGRVHQVMTALCLKSAAREYALVQTSQVRFKTLTTEEIATYIASGEPFDKAGGYGIQGRAALFIEHLEGSYSGVMGLPLYEFGQLMGKLSAHE
jgi:septum formation protein